MNPFPDIPFEIVPVPPFYTALPVPEQQCMLFSSKQIRQTKTLDIKREWFSEAVCLFVHFRLHGPTSLRACLASLYFYWSEKPIFEVVTNIETTFHDIHRSPREISTVIFLSARQRCPLRSKRVLNKRG